MNYSRRYFTLVAYVFAFTVSNLSAGYASDLAELLKSDAKAESLDSFRFTEADQGAVKAYRDDDSVFFVVPKDVSEITMPRLAAPLYTVGWLGAKRASSVIKFHPEQETWILSWKGRPKAAQVLCVRLGAPPKLMKEASAILPSGDGSFWIPGHLGKTAGEKIRYEPQTFKNTVGYWVGKNDNVTWTINAPLPGKFNVGILQGCGKGQGGSVARLTCSGATASSSLDFEVKETGHFQDFQWRHIGVLDIKEGGELELNIAPVEIAKNALMDIRMLVLTPVPMAKK